MAVRCGLVSERWLETGITVKAPFLLRIAVHVPDGEDVETVPTGDCGAPWAPKGVTHDPPGVFQWSQERMHRKTMGAGSYGARRELRSGWLRLRNQVHFRCIEVSCKNEAELFCVNLRHSVRDKLNRQNIFPRTIKNGLQSR